VGKKRDEEARSDSELKRKVFEALATPQVESATSRDIARSLAALNKSVEDSTRRAEDAARRAQWKQKVEAKEAQLQMLERRGKGDSEKALKIEEELNKLYDNPGVMPSVDDSQISTVGGGGSIDGSTGIGSRTGGHGGDKRAGVISVDEGSVSGGAEVLGAGDFFEVAGNFDWTPMVVSCPVRKFGHFLYVHVSSAVVEPPMPIQTPRSTSQHNRPPDLIA